MKVVILSKSMYGSGAFHLRKLIKSKKYSISMVILDESKVNNKKYFKNKLIKNI